MSSFINGSHINSVTSYVGFTEHTMTSGTPHFTCLPLDQIGKAHAVIANGKMFSWIYYYNLSLIQ